MYVFEPLRTYGTFDLAPTENVTETTKVHQEKFHLWVSATAPGFFKDVRYLQILGPKTYVLGSCSKAQEILSFSTNVRKHIKTILLSEDLHTNSFLRYRPPPYTSYISTYKQKHCHFFTLLKICQNIWQILSFLPKYLANFYLAFK